jgi:hypothetical protein
LDQSHSTKEVNHFTSPFGGSRGLLVEVLGEDDGEIEGNSRVVGGGRDEETKVGEMHQAPSNDGRSAQGLSIGSDSGAILEDAIERVG